ncbi:tRNA (adenosine(37)-N6)-dimethylallyltransferase MiaA [Rhizobiaceae bacterium n13]|uniref:tRNA dimethylallyltransferase n=1 Tax=Ferirhizobium litorale TaxID=2927786 RepID=A0AAE3QG92_9HYPH|nr:tRNA (adenosine(37)-N6)-dimethylallyltransferase MiaA [Fererhizobium litorale]MDI7863682.1 tRNA (adenosine(37)-N6)-dimethylallyltransferase MiaA [Fererhizobium litorale]MDI7923348.1 tRNA (adenosine(37)-N6)-dimethylallyltransferase MiaA [Fererhizobium litorale]
MDMDAILITGPTASGKSALALDLARRHGGVVINADSMQVYDTLRVLTARPSEAEMEGIPHLLYGHVPAGETYSTGDWLRQAERLVDELRRERRLPVFVGGTGLYFKALTGGLSAMPAIPDEIRDRFRARLIEEGPGSLHAELMRRDPQTAATLQPADGQRIVRALEVLEATGQPIRAFQGQAGTRVIDPARARKIVVQPERSVLYERIDRRFKAMMESGAVEEVQALLALELKPQMPVMKAIGVSQIAAMLKGELSADEVIDKSATATRQYAKRQMTWFRNQMDESWSRRG